MERITNRKCRKLWPWLVALAILLALLYPTLGLAQSGPNTMNFQGRLLDSGGNPRGGETHCMRFRMCSDSSCTTQVWPSSGYEEQVVTTESGAYKAGLFTVALGTSNPIPPTLMYDHDELYLEIGVADETSCPGSTWWTMTPRSPLRANAYAQRSRRVRTSESDDDYLVRVTNAGAGGGVYAETYTTLTGRAAGEFYANSSSGATYGVYAHNNSSTDDAAAGRFIADGSSGATDGLYVLNRSTGNNARAGHFYAAGGTGQTCALYAQNDSVSNNAAAGHFLAYGDTGETFGVHGENRSGSTGATGVFGQAGSLGGQVYGVYGKNASSTNDAAGVYGYATASYGQTYGVYGRTDSTTQGTAGVYAYAGGNGGQVYSVYAVNDSSTDYAAAGHFEATASTGQTYGIYAYAASPLGDGVHAQGLYHGVYGEGTDSSGVTYGVYGVSNRANGYGVWGQSTYKTGVRGTSTYSYGVEGSSSNGYGVYGRSNNSYAVYSDGDMHVAGDLTWQAKTGHVAVAPAAFGGNVGGCLIHHGRYCGACDGWTTYASMGSAGVQLPHGSTVTQLAFGWVDSSSTYNGCIKLMRANLGVAEEMAAACTSGSSGIAAWSSDTTISYATVDNSLYVYYVEFFSADEAPVGISILLYEALIDYSFTEPY